MRGYFLVLGAGFLWGSLGIIGQYLYGYGIDPLTVVTFRALFAFIGLILIGLMKSPKGLKIDPSDLGFFCIFGLISVSCFYWLYFTAVKMTDVATAAVLLYTAPAFVMLLSAKIFREKITKQKVVSLLLTFGGCLFVVKAYDLTHLRLSYLGILVGIGSGFTYALFSIFGKKGLEKYDEQTVLLYAFGFGTLFLAVLNNPIKAIGAGYPGTAWILMAVLAVFPTLLANSLYTAGLKYVEASKASILATVEPVVAVVLAYLLFGEVLEPLQLLGIILVVCGVALTRIGGRRTSDKPADEEQVRKI
jgi:DME family drug/metabolite transporter